MPRVDYRTTSKVSAKPPSAPIAYTCLEASYRWPLRVTPFAVWTYRQETRWGPCLSR